MVHPTVHSKDWQSPVDLNGKARRLSSISSNDRLERGTIFSYQYTCYKELCSKSRIFLNEK